MHQITSYLWISDLQTVRELSTDGIDHAIGVCQDGAADNVGCSYEHFKIADGVETGLVPGDASYGAFAEAVDATLSAFERGDTTLVHCHKGQSRSVMVATAALAVHRDEGFTDVVGLIHDSGRTVLPSVGVVKHAKRYIDTHQ